MRLALSQQEEASTRAVTAASSVNSQMAGLVLLSGMLATQDGGHPIFRLPVFALDYLQPSLTASFLQMAFEPGCEPELLASQEAACNANPMHVCKAYYRQVRGLSAEAIRSLSTGPLPCWLAHGDADGVLPIAGAVALHAVLEPATRGELIVFPGASHNFILERAAAAADLLHEILQELATR
ncbi:unnamed protein product [Polarella glacialis]|uniref:Serine aminopeptidase S33 domain-containing protein n=1 Tax=Polarella glacialis TaxID=89957 RepID=A0A813GGT3_POLGL|nr:unnamed protein product [Polarella glacialis]